MSVAFDLDDVLEELDECIEHDRTEAGDLLADKYEWQGHQCPTPSNLLISTMTVCAEIGTTLNVVRFCDWLTLVPQWRDEAGPLMVEQQAPSPENPEVNRKHQTRQRRGTFKKILMEADKETKAFFNAASIYQRQTRDGEDGEVVHKEPNVKLFENGRIQMTGTDDFDMARAVLEDIIGKMRECHREMVGRGERGVVGDERSLGLRGMSIHLLNSDFNARFSIHRTNLQQILKERQGLICRLETTRYQGVDTKQMQNIHNTHRDGVCHCRELFGRAELCDGTGRTPEYCKQITISPFESGNIIITGAKSKEQLDEAMGFITGVFRRHFGSVCLGLHPDDAELRKISRHKKNKVFVSANKRVMQIPSGDIRYHGSAPAQ